MKVLTFILVMLAGVCLLSHEGSAAAAAKCEAGKNYAAVDLSEPVTEEFARKVKSIGVDTIVRYYDWKEETIKGETLSDAELKIISKVGLSVAVVFQHNSGSIYTFMKDGRGKTDAERSLDLAGLLLQPKGSAIYLGVDGPDALVEDALRGSGVPEIPKYLMNFIEKQVGRYFEEASPLVRGAGYKIGVYGGGLVCGYLLGKKLVNYCWLSMSTGWPGYEKFETGGKWTLKQVGEGTDCFGKSADLSIAREASPEFGQWRPKK
jgi:Domain of unknown function (DUF1906)